MIRKKFNKDIDKELADLDQLYKEKLNQLNNAIQNKGLRLLEGPNQVSNNL